MIIKLLNLSEDEFEYSTISDAEIAIANCVTPVDVLVIEKNEQIRFVFNPLNDGFRSALLRIKNDIYNKRNNIKPSIEVTSEKRH